MSREAKVVARAQQDLRSILRLALSRGASEGKILSVGLALGGLSLPEMWASGAGKAAVLYAPASGIRSVGIGRAAELVLDRPDAQAMRRWADKTFARIHQVGQRSRLTVPRVFGGMAFSAESATQSPWKRFGAMQFRLPRWVYALQGTQSALTFYAPVELLGDGAEVLRELENILCAGAARRPRRAAKCLPIRQLSRARWNKLMRAALTEIRSAAFHKIVLARQARVRNQGPWDLTRIVQRVCEVPDSTAFALSDGRQTFVGATPERLIQKRGTRIQTEALAGTAASTEAPEILQRRVKDLQEHAFVVQEIARRLKGVCRELRIGKRPRLRRLTDVVHLRTEIRGTLAREAHVLALALRLHPTPAVGGLPGKQATHWIDAHEPVPRGWYAGFFGWFDAQGDGELSVSIRSGLLKGRGVQLFAGAGIVAQSNAAAEYLETALKQRTFLRVLGVRT